MSTIWVVNEAGHNYEPARDIAGEGAEIKPLTLGNVNPLQVDRLAWHLTRGIVRFASPEDYLIFSGTPVINALALHIWLTTHGLCQTLVWDAKRREYKLSTLTIEQLQRIVDVEQARG